jgi:hypothetical protein
VGGNFPVTMCVFPPTQRKGSRCRRKRKWRKHFPIYLVMEMQRMWATKPKAIVRFCFFACLKWCENKKRWNYAMGKMCLDRILSGCLKKRRIQIRFSICKLISFLCPRKFVLINGVTFRQHSSIQFSPKGVCDH